METKFYETLHEVKSHNRVTYNSDEHDGSKDSLILSLWRCAKKKTAKQTTKSKKYKNASLRFIRRKVHRKNTITKNKHKIN